jgi:hypothetical protein
MVAMAMADGSDYYQGLIQKMYHGVALFEVLQDEQARAVDRRFLVGIFLIDGSFHRQDEENLGFDVWSCAYYIYFQSCYLFYMVI